MSVLTWDEVSQRFSAARNWWVSTSGEDGPHAVPVWGVVLDGVLTFYGADDAVRSRNLVADPRAVLHLEDGDSPLIVHGTVSRAGVVDDREDLAAAYRAKYTEPVDIEFLPSEPGYAGIAVWSLTPTKALAWSLVASDQWDVRRWLAASS